MSLLVKVTGAIIQRNDKFLIGRRAPSEKSPGLWEFPGGKLELGETLQECIKRELKEELGIEAEVGDLYLHYNYEYPQYFIRSIFF
jgi:ADP-ribose pyrophosphatase